MLENKTNRVTDRIESLSQPCVRPIIRGKSKAPTEFDEKISISVVSGHTFADKIYRSGKNRRLCKGHGIKLSDLKLGKTCKKHIEEMWQKLKEIRERNAIEGKFGYEKRKLSLIMVKQKKITDSMIPLDIFVLNMEHYMRARNAVGIS